LKKFVADKAGQLYCC